MTDPLHIVQLTDLHLLAGGDSRLAGVPTRRTLEAVLASVRERDPDFDLMILTGDLAHDETEGTYRVLGDLLGEWRRRCRLLPGNHDDPTALHRVFPDRIRTRVGRMCFAERLGAWRVIGLDSHVPGEVGGRLGLAQTQWLEMRLAEACTVPTVLFVHHPPAPVGTAWLDESGLADGAALCELIERHPQVKLVAAGHVHQAREIRLGAATLCTTPSTAFQFDPTGRERYEAVAPGYRRIRLDGEAFHTEVVRLPDVAYPPGPPDG